MRCGVPGSAFPSVQHGVRQLRSGLLLLRRHGGRCHRDADSGLQNTVRVGLALYEGTASSTATQSQILTATKDSNIKDIAIWEPNASDHVEYIVENNNKLIDNDGNEYKFEDGQAITTYAFNKEKMYIFRC